jgi:2-polyprenyl-3-methyl-5-hydroxy-6-metoxy-1,4-benzoquinol methylase
MHEIEPGVDRQVRFWNEWNVRARELAQGDVVHRQAEVVSTWLDNMEKNDLQLLDVGCGTGWFSSVLRRYGTVTGTDLADIVLERARIRDPEVTFISGDFMQLSFGQRAFDVIVALEVLSHVADQEAFLTKVADLLKPTGHLMLATQNRTVLERFNRIPPPAPGQLRQWVNKNELRELLMPKFDILEVFSVTPRANRGLMRLVNSEKVNAPIRTLLGDRLDLLKEQLGLGWTLMCHARRRPELAYRDGAHFGS